MFLTGQPDPASATNILSGTITTTVVGHVGELVSRTVTDKATTLVLDRQTYGYTDEFYRAHTVTNLDGTVETVTYACCGLNTETNALGGVTTYTETTDGYGQRVRTATTSPGGATRIETYYQDGSLRSVSGSAAQPVEYQYGLNANTQDADYLRPFTLEIRLADNGGTNEWTRTYSDFLGRTFKTLYADDSPASFGNNPYRQSFFNNNGQLTRERDPDGVSRLYAYNPRGEPYRTGIDLDGNGLLEPNGSTATDDRLTETFEVAVPALIGTNGLSADLRRVQKEATRSPPTPPPTSAPASPARSPSPPTTPSGGSPGSSTRTAPSRPTSTTRRVCSTCPGDPVRTRSGTATIARDASPP